METRFVIVIVMILVVVNILYIYWVVYMMCVIPVTMFMLHGCYIKIINEFGFSKNYIDLTRFNESS